MEGEKNALDAMKQLWEKEGGKINRVLLVWSSFFYSLKRQQICRLPRSRFSVVTHDAPPRKRLPVIRHQLIMTKHQPNLKFINFLEDRTRPFKSRGEDPSFGS